jgi:hypothetical protein
MANGIFNQIYGVNIGRMCLDFVDPEASSMNMA